jgi:hypothetical protein
MDLETGPIFMVLDLSETTIAFIWFDTAAAEQVPGKIQYRCVESLEPPVPQ